MKVMRYSWSLPSGDRENLNGPPIKILEKRKKKKKPNKGILLMVLNNGGARFPWTWTYEVPMDVRAGLTRGSYGWRTRDPWMTR